MGIELPGQRFGHQLHRQAKFNEGKDLRQKPYVLFRTRIDAGPVLLVR